MRTMSGFGEAVRRAARGLALLLEAGGVAAPAVATAREESLRTLASIAGVRSNQLIGYGLVVGLDGTGDQTTQAPFTRQSVISMLQALGIALPPGQSFQLRNTAAVMVTSVLPPFARPGQSIDVVVSSLGNARSLRGGTLLMTPLRGPDGQVYGLAQGNVLVGGAGASAGGAAVQVNHLAAGRIPLGGTVERGVAVEDDQEFAHVELGRSDYSLMQRVVEAVNNRFGPGRATPVDSRALRVALPESRPARIAFLAELEQIPVSLPDDVPRVVVNSRTGSVVVNQHVTIGPCAVAHGSLSVRISREPQVSQPQPFSRGETAVTTRDVAEVEEPRAALIQLPRAASLDEVVRALNLLGATVTDLISILQAMKSAGALNAELEVI